MPKLRNDLTGLQFGRLTVMERAEDYISPPSYYDPGARQTRHVRWKCKCACGGEAIVPTFNLLSGKTQSCGCYRKELALKKMNEIQNRHKLERMLNQERGTTNQDG